MSMAMSTARVNINIFMEPTNIMREQSHPMKRKNTDYFQN